MCMHQPIDNRGVVIFGFQQLISALGSIGVDFSQYNAKYHMAPKQANGSVKPSPSVQRSQGQSVHGSQGLLSPAPVLANPSVQGSKPPRTPPPQGSPAHINVNVCISPTFVLIACDMLANKCINVKCTFAHIITHDKWFVQISSLYL